MNLTDVLSSSSGVCITEPEDADLTTSQCHQTSAAPPESTYLMPPVTRHCLPQLKTKPIQIKALKWV